MSAATISDGDTPEGRPATDAEITQILGGMTTFDGTTLLDLYRESVAEAAAARPDPLESALIAAWNAGEPELPECHRCGKQTGTWVPDPSGDRWPSGAQKLLCAGGCKGGAT